LLWKKFIGSCYQIFYKLFTKIFIGNTYEFYNFVGNNYQWINYLPIKLLRKIAENSISLQILLTNL